MGGATESFTTLTPLPCLLTTGEINEPAPFLSNDISHLLPSRPFYFLCPSSLPHRVPQGLLYLDVLQYSDELMGRLVRGEHVEVGSSEEVEIRGCSIWAVEVSSSRYTEIYNCFCFVSAFIFSSSPALEAGDAYTLVSGIFHHPFPLPHITAQP